MRLGQELPCCCRSLFGAFEVLAGYPLAETAMRVALAAVIVVYGMVLMYAQKKYLVG